MTNVFIEDLCAGDLIVFCSVVTLIVQKKKIDEYWSRVTYMQKCNVYTEQLLSGYIFQVYNR